MPRTPILVPCKKKRIINTERQEKTGNEGEKIRRKKSPGTDDNVRGKNEGRSATKNIPFQWNMLVSRSPISELWESKCLFKTERMKGKKEENGKGKKDQMSG